MATQCFPPIFGKRLRTTRLDACNNLPASGTEDAFVVDDGFVTVSLTSEIEDGVDISQRRADGAICIRERGPDTFERFTVEVDFCEVNPSLFEIVTGSSPVSGHGGDVEGFQQISGTIDQRFSLEVWMGLSGVACEPGEEEAGAYLLLPALQAGTLGDLEIGGEDRISFMLTGAFTRDGNQWGTGPFDVLQDDVGDPAPLFTPADPNAHLYLIRTGLAPPPDACDPQTMP